MGALIVLFFAGVRYWLQDLGISMNWWKWALLVLWFTILGITLGGGFTLMGENEWSAGIRFMVFFGVILLLAGAGLWLILTKSRAGRSG